MHDIINIIFIKLQTQQASAVRFDMEWLLRNHFAQILLLRIVAELMPKSSLSSELIDKNTKSHSEGSSMILVTNIVAKDM